MNAMKHTRLLSAGALSVALMLSAPAMAAEGKSPRGVHAGGDRSVQVGGHRSHARGPRRDFRGSRRDFSRHGGHYRGGRGHYRGPRGHYRPGHRHWRGQRYWYRHRPYRRGHHYWWNPRYGRSYGYGYGRLGYGASFVVPIN